MIHIFKLTTHINQFYQMRFQSATKLILNKRANDEICELRV